MANAVAGVVWIRITVTQCVQKGHSASVRPRLRPDGKCRDASRPDTLRRSRCRLDTYRRDTVRPEGLCLDTLCLELLLLSRRPTSTSESFRLEGIREPPPNRRRGADRQAQ